MIGARPQPLPDPETAAHLAAIDGPVVAWFAPFHPDAGGRRLVEAFHVLATWHRPDAFVVMAGPDDDRHHREALQALVTDLALDRSWLAVNPSPARRAAFRARADVALSPAVLAAADRAAGRRIGAVELGAALAGVLDRP